MATATYIDENGKKQSGTTANDMDGLYQQMYESNISANEQQAAAAKAEAQRQADYAKQAAQQQYAAADKQAYSDYMHSIKALPEELAAYGINGGLAESSRVKLDTNYGNIVNANQQQRIAGERDIDNQTAAQMYQTQAQLAAANNEARQRLDAQRIALRQEQMQKASDELAAIGDYSGLVAQGVLTEEQAAKKAGAWQAANSADMLAANGDFSGYVQLGVLTPEQAAMKSEAWKAQNSADMLAASGDYSGYVKLGILTQEQADRQKALYEAQNSADMLAQVGDFSGYVALGRMTPEQAEMMKQAWIAQNGELAKALGYVQSGGGGGGSVPQKKDTDGEIPTIDLNALMDDMAKERMTWDERQEKISEVMKLANSGAVNIDYSTSTGKGNTASGMDKKTAEKYLAGMM